MAPRLAQAGLARVVVRSLLLRRSLSLGALASDALDGGGTYPGVVITDTFPECCGEPGIVIVA